MTKTSAPATAAQIAAEAHLPAHKRTATVVTDTDARATVGKSNVIHRATKTEYLNAAGDHCGQHVDVHCGAERRRGGRSAASAAPARYAVECSKCLAE